MLTVWLESLRVFSYCKLLFVHRPGYLKLISPKESRGLAFCFWVFLGGEFERHDTQIARYVAAYENFEYKIYDNVPWVPFEMVWR